MRATLCILMVMSIWMLLAQQKCPSGYFYLGGEGGWYSIPNAIKEGYISYGANGRFILLPFTNKDSKDLDVGCTSDLGEPWPFGATKKECCFKPSKNTGYGNYWHEAGIQWGTVYNEGATIPVAGWPYAASRFGLNNKWLYQVTSNIDVYCGCSTFGAILDQMPKKCSVVQPPQQIKAVLANDKWTLCGTASGGSGKYCEGLEKGTVHWIRFGSQNKYHYTMVISGDGKFPCHHTSITSANSHDDGAMCWRSPPDYNFRVSGEWVSVVSCSGCAPLEYTVSIGLSSGKEIERTEDWYWSLSVTMSASFEYGAASGGMSVTAEVGQTVSNRMMHSITEEKVQEVSVKCALGKESLYQFVTTVKETLGSQTREREYRFGGDIYRCQGNVPPRCPPEYCKDDNCQTCKDECKYKDGQTCTQVASGGRVIHEPSTWLQIPDVTISLLWICILSGMVIILLFSNVAVILRSCYNGKKKGYDVVAYDSEQNPLQKI